MPAAPSRSTTTPPKILHTAWPLLVEMGMGIGAGLICTMLAAHRSDAAGAAFALANQLWAALFLLFRIIGAGVGVVITQRLGAGRREAADRAARTALGASTWLGSATALLALAASTPLLRALNAPADILPDASRLLQMLAPALLLDTLNASMVTVVRSHFRTRDALVVTAATTLCHVLASLVLVPGVGPIPGYGLSGFAIALTASRAVGLLMLLWLWRWRLGLNVRSSDWWKVSRGEIAAVLHIGVPSAAENVGYRLALLTSVAAAGELGAHAVATQAYVLQIAMCTIVFGLSIGFAAEITIGHLIGAGQFRAAHRLVRWAMSRGLLISVLVSGITALSGPVLMRSFTSAPDIVANGTVLLWLGVLLEPGRTFNLIVINALRAAGDARFPVMAGAASMLIVLAGGSWLLGVKLGLGLPGVWLAYVGDEWLRGLMMWARWTQRRWVSHARRSRRGAQTASA